jgi:hypothetical protein
VIECVPTVSDEVLTETLAVAVMLAECRDDPSFAAVADCFGAFANDAVPMGVAPSKNCTEPVGDAPMLLVTVAVNDTDCPATEGLMSAATLVVVVVLPTVSDNTAEVLGLKLASLPYTAVIECTPTVSDEVANVAWPEPFNVPVPIVAAPSLNVTEPVGVPAPGATAATVAVNVTDCSTVEGFALDATVVVVFDLLTVSERAEDVLGVKFVSSL